MFDTKSSFILSKLGIQRFQSQINNSNSEAIFGVLWGDILTLLDKSFNELEENELNLLTPLMDDRSKTLMRAIDHTNNKYGRHAITIASAGIHKGWKMRREHSSKIDTASFNYLPKVSAS